MNISKMYVPNVDKWVRYYKDVASGKENVYIENTTRDVKQRGGGLSQNPNEFMISIDKSNRQGEKSLPAREINLNMISPAQEVVERAKSELKREHSPQFYHSSKRFRRVHSSSKKQNRRKKSIKKLTKKKTTKTASKKTTKAGKKATRKSIKEKFKNKKSTQFLSKWLQ